MLFLYFESTCCSILLLKMKNWKIEKEQLLPRKTNIMLAVL